MPPATLTADVLAFSSPSVKGDEFALRIHAAEQIDLRGRVSLFVELAKSILQAARIEERREPRAKGVRLHSMERARRMAAWSDFQAGKFSSLAAACRAHGVRTAPAYAWFSSQRALLKANQDGRRPVLKPSGGIL